MSSFHYILILADEIREERPLDSDAHNLSTLLLLRDLRHRQSLAALNAQELALGLNAANHKFDHKYRQKHDKNPKDVRTEKIMTSQQSKPFVSEPDSRMNQRLPTKVSGEFAEKVLDSSDTGNYHWSRPGTTTTPTFNDDGTDSSSGIIPLSETSLHSRVDSDQKCEAPDVGLLRAIQIQRANSMGHETLEDDKSLLDSDDDTKSLEKKTPRRGNEDDNELSGSGADVNTHFAITGPGCALNASSQQSTAKSIGNPTTPNKSKSHQQSTRTRRSAAAKAAKAAAIASADMCVIAVEILDSRTKSTLQSEPSIFVAADYLLSNTTMSKVLAMVLMQREVKGVLEELLSEEGQSFFVHQATRHCRINEVAAFWDIASRALSCGEILVGYRPTSSGTTIINPLAKHEPRIWGEYDLIVVCSNTEAMMTSAKHAVNRMKRASSLSIKMAMQGFTNKTSRRSDTEASASSISNAGGGQRRATGLISMQQSKDRTGVTNDDKSLDGTSDDLNLGSRINTDAALSSTEAKKPSAYDAKESGDTNIVLRGSYCQAEAMHEDTSVGTGEKAALLSAISGAGNEGRSEELTLPTVTAASEFTDQVRIFALNNAMDGTGEPARRKMRDSESDVSDESGSSEYDSESSDEFFKDGTRSFEFEDTPKTKLRKQRSEKRIARDAPRREPRMISEAVVSTSAAADTLAVETESMGNIQVIQNVSSAVADHSLARASFSPPPRGSQLAPLNDSIVSPLPTMTSPNEQTLLATPVWVGTYIERGSPPDSLRSMSAL